SFFEVPTEGVSVDGNMYVYHTTDHTTEAAMGRSVVAVSKDDGHTFRYLYDLSTQHFINVSIVEVDTRQWKGLPEQKDIGLVMFGSGTYRKSDVRLAFQPAARIESRESIRFFAGVDIFGMPVWSASEDAAKPLFHEPCIGEFSVSFNRYIRKWIMLYHCGPDPQGIQIRTSDQPWGAWSASKVLFEAGRDDAYCRFIHAQWDWKRCDILHDPGREYRRGAMYGPYQFEDLAVGDNTSTTIYFTVSTWNPYTVILMKATLRRVPQESPLPDCAFRTSPTGSQYEFPVTVYSEGQRMNR
ncbi:MAG: DUF4185 domain-containing protein, partial [Deltaproteobacteria bacterium]|nr:DUF4185 domain-containing protein [Deltaproteobacteria bacterium]